MKLTDVLTQDGDALFVVSKGGQEVSPILRVREDLFVQMPTTVDVSFGDGAVPRRVSVTAGWNAREWAALPEGHPAKGGTAPEQDRGPA
jgi:hypothetical protein